MLDHAEGLVVIYQDGEREDVLNRDAVTCKKSHGIK